MLRSILYFNCLMMGLKASFNVEVRSRLPDSNHPLGRGKVMTFPVRQGANVGHLKHRIEALGFPRWCNPGEALVLSKHQMWNDDLELTDNLVKGEIIFVDVQPTRPDNYASTYGPGYFYDPRISVEQMHARSSDPRPFRFLKGEQASYPSREVQDAPEMNPQPLFAQPPFHQVGGLHNGDLLLHNGDLLLHKGDLILHNGDLLLHNGDLLLHKGDLLLHKGDLILHNGDASQQQYPPFALAVQEARVLSQQLPFGGPIDHYCAAIRPVERERQERMERERQGREERERQEREGREGQQNLCCAAIRPDHAIVPVDEQQK